MTPTTPTTPSPLVHKLLALFVAGALLFNFPLLRLWLGEGLWFGLPRLPLALFVAWAVLIALLAWWMERADTGAADASDPGVEP